MRINLSEQEKNKCLKLLEVKENNIQSVEFLIDYLIYHCRDIANAKDEKDWFEKFLKIEQIPEEIIHNSSMDKITKLDPNTFLNDAYYKTIGQLEEENDEWKLMSLDYAPYEGFVSDEISIDSKFYNEHTPLSYFEKPFKYLAVLQNDEIWMSVMPHEINTMKEPIKNAHGNVLVLGLGLGYYLFNIVSKRNVKKVTIIENDKRAILLFNEYLLPKFPNQEKINIVFGDAIEYVKNTKEKFDYCFADIWHNVSDGEMLYLKIKANEKYHPETKFDYWIETSILAMVRRQTLTVFEEALNNVDESIYTHNEIENDKIINAIYFYLKDKEIKTFDDLHDIISEKSLKVMCKNLF